MALTQIFSHELADLYFDENTFYLEERWKPTSENATDEDFKTYQHQKIEIAKKYEIRFFLCDTRDFLYVISIEMQEWTDKIVMGFWDSSALEKLAFLTSAEIISQLSIEQTMAENIHKYPIQYFDEKTEAIEWLLS